MELKDIIAAIQSVGFPVVMVLWFMLRTEKVIAANTAALTTLALTESQEREALRQLLDKSGVKT
jgi:hypothetical protein